MFDFLAEQAHANANVKLHCGYGPVRFALVVDGDVTHVAIDGDGVRLSDAAPAAGDDFTLAASAAHWAELLKDAPAPGFQTLSAMRRTQNLIVTGDMTKFFQHMMLLEMLFSGLSDNQPAVVLDEPETEPVTGRYLRLMLEGKPHRLYFEEAGDGM